MKTTTIAICAACLGIVALPVNAASRSSASYEISVETADAGGGRVNSGSYIADTSTGSIGGISSVVSPDIVAKTGYTGQLYEVTGLTVSATPNTVGEGSTRQLDAVADLDDATTLNLHPSEVAWNVVSGPLTGINSGGLATAGAVLEDTLATAEGSYQSVSDLFDLTVLNVDPDNFAEYGGDDLDDDWQVQHFGNPPNPDAAPGENPDGDNGDNEFEFLTGFDPNDPKDYFRFEIVDVNGTTATYMLNKVIPDRTYTLKASTDLIDFGETVTSFSVNVETFDYPVEDSGADGPRKFHIIEVTKP